METISVKELLELCKNEVKLGNGNKKILISADDEGNSYHELFYGFTNDTKEFKELIYCLNDDDLENYIILG